MARAKYQFLPDLSEDDIRLLDRVSDWIMAADEKYITKFSAFLDERQCLLCEKIMASVKYENYRLWGGYENAARRMLCVYPEYGEAESEDFPITAITLLYRKEDKITHRDILGFGADMKMPQGVCCASILNMARQKVRIFLSPQLHCCIAKRIK